jgi:cation:H+ antiporter
MYGDLPLWLALLFVLGGFAVLAWSSDLFVDGAAVVAKAFGISPFIIGMVIIGFGTSAPELCVSVLSGLSGHSNVSLGNAYGSCIFNIAAILGVAALIRPLAVPATISFVAVPLLAGVTGLSWALLRDGACSRLDALALLTVFAVAMPLYCRYDQAQTSAAAPANAPAADGRPPRRQTLLAAVKLAVGLALLIGSSHLLVWGAVDLARAFGVSELMIGLTIVAVGTSLPELASAVASARRGEHAFVLGNIVGSNLFNTLAVVGLSSALSPATSFSPYVLTRDLPLIFGLTLSVALFGLHPRRPRADGTINRLEGVVWIALFIAYTVLLFFQETGE